MKIESREKLEKIYLTVIEYGTYLALFTPLIFMRNFFFPFVVPKTIFFRVIVDIIFIAYIGLVVSNRKYLPRINFFTLTILIFIGILILTSFTGVNLKRSFWSVFERMTGLITFFHLLVFYFILSSVFTKRAQWEKILTVSIIVGVLVCFYAWTSVKETATRFGGTLGNSSFLAGYVLFDIFFALILFLTKEDLWKVFYGFSLIILVASVIFSFGEVCKGAVGAFFIGMTILTYGYLVYCSFVKNNKILKSIVIFIPFLIILITVILLYFNILQPQINKLWQGSSVQSRLVVWKMSFEGWKERFWLGWGPENFNVAFAKYFNPQLPLTYDIWYDRAHNFFFDTAVTSGMVGIISYFVVFGAAVFSLIRITPKISNCKNAIFPLGMIALLIVYLAQDAWVFDMISSYALLFLTLAFINFLILPPVKEQKETSNPAEISPLAFLTSALLVILTILTFYFGNIKPAQASNYALKGLSGGTNLSQSLDYFQSALASSPMSGFEIPEQFLDRMSAFAFQSNQNKQTLNQALTAAEESMKASIKQGPLDFRLQLFLGKYYLTMYSASGNGNYIGLADEILNRAKSLSPRNQQDYWFLAQLKVYQGKKTEAVDLLKQAVDLEPKLGQAHWFLAMGYQINGEYQLALSEINEAEKNGYDWKNSIDDLKQVISIYQVAGDFNDVIPLYEKAQELSPKDYELWRNLAYVYAQVGQKQKAVEAILKAKELNPDMATETEQFLESLSRPTNSTSTKQ